MNFMGFEPVKRETDHVAVIYHILVSYILSQSLLRRDSNLRSFGQCSDRKLQKGNSGPDSIPGMSHSHSYHVFVNKQSACAALGHCRQNIVATLKSIFSLLSLLSFLGLQKGLS